ncbi:MAG: murein biosynthesis integral membrane protein MurJ [Gammaproteobacteria bacterium 28-57-27]|nr:MAG: murein biosynthesis integral membrane protein MurJ [Gammaproteobacteria bacterium 28-57-27]
MSRSLLKSTAVISAMTLLSRILGFVRDMVFARLFGASGATDAFFVVFKIPNFLRRLFAEGAFSQAFVPLLAEYREKHSREAMLDLIAHVSGTLGAVLLLITTLGVAAAPLLLFLFAPGFHADATQFALAEDMLRITFPYIFFISLTAFASSLLNSFSKFAIPALTPIWLNIVLIAAAFLGANYADEPMLVLSWGVLVAGMVQLGFQLPWIWRMGLLPRPRFSWAHEGVQRTFKLMLPAIFGSSVTQINLLLDTVLASFLIAGSVSWLYYSDRLVEFPLGMFGVALATVILPKLSREHSRDEGAGFQQTLDWGLRLTVLLALPATVGLVVLAGPLLATLFEYGKFDLHDTQMASMSLVAYGLGLPAFLLIKVLAPGFYARQDMVTPVRIGIHAVLSNLAFKAAVVLPMVILAIPGTHAALAAATSFAAMLNAWWLYQALRKSKVYQPSRQWRRWWLQAGAATLVMGGLLFWLMPLQAVWTAMSGGMRALWLAGLVFGALASYVAVLLALGLRPRDLKREEAQWS